MTPVRFVAISVTFFVLSFPDALQAEDTAPMPVLEQNQVQVGPGQQIVRGVDLVSGEEQLDFQQRLRSAASEEERTRIWNQHRALLEQRAREKGVLLPWQAGMNGQGRGMGADRGQGRGRGNRNQ